MTESFFDDFTLDKVVCIKDCTTNAYTNNIIENIYIDTIYYTSSKYTTSDDCDVFDSELEYIGQSKRENFITIADFREKQINNILYE